MTTEWRELYVVVTCVSSTDPNRYIYIYMYIGCLCVYICTYIYTFIYIYTHTHMYIHTHICIYITCHDNRAEGAILSCNLLIIHRPKPLKPHHIFIPLEILHKSALQSCYISHLRASWLLRMSETLSHLFDIRNSPKVSSQKFDLVHLGRADLWKCEYIYLAHFFHSPIRLIANDMIHELKLRALGNFRQRVFLCNGHEPGQKWPGVILKFY